MGLIIALFGVTLLEACVIAFLFVKNRGISKSAKELMMEKERYRIACDISNDILFEYDMYEDLMVFSPKYEDSFGKSCRQEHFYEKVLGSNYVQKEDQSVFLEFASALRKGKSTIEAEFRMRTTDDSYVWCQVRGRTIYDSNYSPVKVVGKLINIDIQRRELEILQVKAQRDPLTNAYNKGVTEELIDKRIHQSLVGEAHALMIIDIDNFKNVNDTYGHMLGDKVLVNVISHIRRMFRDEDIVGRIGGDEFVVFMSHVNSREDVTNKAVKLFSAFKNFYRQDDEDIMITGSVGISVYPNDGTCYKELLEKADKAMYEVKAKGKNNFNIYSQI